MYGVGNDISWKELLVRYWKIFVGLVLLCVFFISLITLTYTMHGRGVEVTFLDVGQGDAIFIRTENGKNVLVDGGPSEKVLEGLSQHMPLFGRDIDTMIITHADADHVTGLIPVLAKYHVHHIVMSPVRGNTNTFSSLYDAVEHEVDDDGAILHIARTGDKIIFSSSSYMMVLYPPKNISLHTDTNDASISTLFKHDEYTVLLTGDLPITHEDELIPTLSRDVTIYKAGHHGSKTSSGVQLLSYIHPEYVVISAGRNNKYGHPHKETLERLRIYGKEILSTIDSGSITFDLGDTLQVFTEK